MLFCKQTRHFLADTYLGFVFWTVLTSLGLCIWYFPLWHMGISGYEVALFADMAPLLLGIPVLRRALKRFPVISAALSMAGIIAYVWTKPEKRLLAVAIGTAGSMLWLGTGLCCSQGGAPATSAAISMVDRTIYAWEAGLLASVAVRMIFQTNNPVWAVMNASNGGWNKTGVVLGIAALVDVALRRQPGVQVSANRNDDDDAKKLEIPTSTGKRQQPAAWLPAGLGFGALLFALHSLFSDSAIVGRWSWDGFPSTGPAPVPWGGLVLTSLASGFAVGHRSDLTTGLLWWALASVCAGVITFFSGWIGFLAGCVLAAYTGSVSRSVLRAVSTCPPGRTLGVGILWYNILVLGHVWVVAYEFVPGGPVLRERTWVVMALMMLTLRSGIAVARKARIGSTAATVESDGAAARVRARRVGWIAVIVGWLAMAGRQIMAVAPEPYHPNQRLLTTAIWTVHFDLDNDMWLAENRIIAAVRDLQPDVMGFLESDTERIIMGQRDWTQRVGEELGYYVDYGPSPRKHTWGCAMISKYPIVKSDHHLLPSPVGELACAIHATLDVAGRHVDVIISHNGQEENPLDRRLQTTELARIMRESPNPFVFAGYVVTKPHAANYKILYDSGRIHDVDPTDSDRWCQYIGYRGVKRVAYARISRGTITDTEIQAAKFVVPAPGEDISEWSPSYKRVTEAHYEKEYHFPTIFRGKGVRGHFYHVFKEPRYFE